MSSKQLRISAFLILILVSVFNVTVSAQMYDPVKWSSQLVVNKEKTRATAVITATIEKNWHVYSNLVDPQIGPFPLTLEWSVLNGLEPKGELQSDPKPISEFDKIFNAELSYWSDKVTLKQEFDITGPKVEVVGTLRFQACDNSNCLPPTKVPIELTEVIDPQAAEGMDSAVAPEGSDIMPSDSDSVEISELWSPVAFDAGITSQTGTTSSLLWLFGACFLGGLLALLTPCVWPMIPLTVSYFLKKSDHRGSGIGRALAYGLSIIIIYVILGVAVTAIFGASSLNALATSAVCNIIFFLLLVIFAISFFGVFDIKLPSKFVNKMDARAGTATGLLGIFFMAFTLTLVSFSCTGPIIGTLLVEAASSGDKFGPAVGMFGFSLALAIPFALFALFPSWLKKVPRSGGWMDTVKVTLGFIELALSLKFLSVADLAYGWHILDREVFVSLWIAIFVLLGVYLLGGFNFKSHAGEDDTRRKGISVVRFFGALASLAFGIYLLPGLWGAPLKGVSAFVPPLTTQDFNLSNSGYEEFDNYEEGMKFAADNNRPVLVDFSGFGCVNCRKMEGAVLSDQTVQNVIQDNFTVIKLMVDDKKDLPKPKKVIENGKTVTLDTYGDLWSYLQRTKFRANAQPYYVVLNPSTGELLSGPFGYDENIPAFIDFLEKGINKYYN